MHKAIEFREKKLVWQPSVNNQLTCKLSHSVFTKANAVHGLPVGNKKTVERARESNYRNPSTRREINLSRRFFPARAV